MNSMPKKRHLESDTKANVTKLLDAHGWFWWNGKADMYGRSGVSDRLAFRHGIFLAIEVKRGTGTPKPTALQIGFLNSIRAHNGFAFVVNDERLKWLEQFLNFFDQAQALRAQVPPKEVPSEIGSAILNAVHVMTAEL